MFRPTLDHSGFSFTAVNGPDAFDVSILNNGNGVLRLHSGREQLYSNNPLDLTFAAATPEPSTYVLFGTGILGLAGAIRHRFRRRNKPRPIHCYLYMEKRAACG